MSIEIKGGYHNFLDALGFRESNNRYDSVNTFGFMGRWQFGKPRLYDLGFSIDGYIPSGRAPKKLLSREAFLQSPTLQNRLMHMHVGQLKRIINKKYSKYFGKEIKGVVITLSGLVAGAHLKGLGGVSKFLQGHDNTDAYGTKISEYIRKFGGYDLANIPDAELKNNAIAFSDIPEPKGYEHNRSLV